MPRRRLTDLHLPIGVYFQTGRYRFRDANGKWHTLGKAWDREAREAYDKLTSASPAPQTVSALLGDFLKHREAEVRAGRTSKRTLSDNEQEARFLRLVFGQMPAGSVKRQHVARYLKERNDKDGNPSPVRANREIALLSSAYSWAMGRRDWDIDMNPCYGVRRNPERPRRRYIATSELSMWKRTATPRMRAFVLLKRLIGSRQGELLALTDHAVTDRGLLVGISKTGRQKIVRWSWALKTTVRVVMKLAGYAENVVPINQEPRPLFPSRSGDPLSSRGFKSAWARDMKPYRDAGGKAFAENDIRAKSASDLPLDHAQELLDHASPTTTRRVYQRAPAKVRPAR